MNIYLDIDGTILKKDGTLANNFDEFIEYFVNNHEVYWLTTHCRGGENGAIEHILQKNNLSEKTLELLKKIKPTDWSDFKAEAIDLSNDFMWLDDYLMESEMKILKDHGVEENAICINLKENPDELKDMIDYHMNIAL